LWAYDHFLRGREFLYGEEKTLAKFEAAVDQFQHAIRIDPNYAQAYAGLGWAYVFDYMNRWSPNPDRSLELGRGPTRVPRPIEQDHVRLALASLSAPAAVFVTFA
jgi:hypothetical protein